MCMVVSFTMAAHPILKHRFSSMLINHVAKILPGGINNLFIKYQRDIWEGFNTESDRIRSKRNLEGFNCVKEIQAKEATLVKWLKNYNGEEAVPDYTLTRRMDRIMNEHGGLIKDIEQFYRDQKVNVDKLMARFYDSDLVVNYEGYKERENVMKVIAGQMAILKLHKKEDITEIYKSLLTSCANSIINIHKCGNRKIDMAHHSPCRLSVKNKITVMSPARSSAGGSSSSSSSSSQCEDDCERRFESCIVSCYSTSTTQAELDRCGVQCVADGLNCLSYCTY